MRKNDYDNYNDFNENERLIAKYLADVFREQIPDEEIPKPDLSFMYADNDGLGSSAGPNIRGRRGASSLFSKKRRIIFAPAEAQGCPPYRKHRFTAVRRVAAAFCVICAVFVASSGMSVVVLSDSEAYAENPIKNFFTRCISYISYGPESDIDFSDESYSCKEVFEESGISNIKKMLPEMMIVGNVPERYEFTSLKLEEYGKGYFMYTYEYENPSDPEDVLCIEGLEKLNNQQVFLYGSSTKIDSVNCELYCQDDVSTGNITGTCLLSNQILTITGKLSQNEVVDIAKSLSV